jgi:hypothetical protein
VLTQGRIVVAGIKKIQPQDANRQQRTILTGKSYTITDAATGEMLYSAKPAPFFPLRTFR